jgi:Ca2+-binding RTX toxin-like protein
MAGIPDGLGVYDNNDGTYTLLMNHEIGNTQGIVRAHGAKGAFVSSWVINKADQTVVSGSDLMKTVYSWNTTTQSIGTPITFAFNRFCSADLPSVSAYYNPATGLGTQARIYMHGEEGGATGYQLATVATGTNAGNSYILGKFNLTTNGSGLTGVGAWENALANPFPQDKTVVIGNNDGGTGIMSNSISVYVGTKTNTGTEVDKAGLTNGTLKFVNVVGNPAEIVNTTTRATTITNGTRFTLNGTASTTFSRPEDGAWNPQDPRQFFFVTTDRLDQVSDNVGTQIGVTRLWRLTFDDITNPDAGGTIDLLIDGDTVNGTKVNMFDNITFDKYGHIILLEDVGNAAHNGKVWQYDIATDSLKLIAKHDPARFGDIIVGNPSTIVPATAPFTQDEETSGVIDVQDTFSAGWFLLDDQAHYPNTTELVEGGQLMALYNPDTYTSFYNTIPASATINGTPGRDTLDGTDADNKIVGGFGGDTLTGGKGSDAFVYTSIRDAGDTITDFTVYQDRIVLTDLLRSIGYSGTDPIADGYVKFVLNGSTATLQIDQDGNGTAAVPRNFLTLQNVPSTITLGVLNAASNFAF